MCPLKLYRYVKTTITNNGLTFHHKIFHIYLLLSSKFICIVAQMFYHDQLTIFAQ